MISLSDPEISGPHNDVGEMLRSGSGPETPGPSFVSQQAYTTDPSFATDTPITVDHSVNHIMEMYPDSVCSQPLRCLLTLPNVAMCSAVFISPHVRIRKTKVRVNQQRCLKNKQKACFSWDSSVTARLCLTDIILRKLEGVSNSRSFA